NNLLQGDFEDSGIVLSRFMINSTLGILGFGDPAYSEFGLSPKPADFGQTLGKYGVGEGLYLYWPVFGPSNVRDFLGYVADSYTHPVPYLSDKILEEMLYYSVNKLNLISLNPDLYDDMKKFSLDPYVAARQAYYDYRRARIMEGSTKKSIHDMPSEEPSELQR
ncbi:MAG: MlaA family lipoprotein, partial [Melioribacteraceae bacterium]|nr:MlaA family lipoprotein [Melioribacteraceae bacterium]